MGHAGAIIAGGKGTAQEKMAAMRKAGIRVVESPAEIGDAMQKALTGRRSPRRLKRTVRAKVKRNTGTTGRNKGKR
jgi:hypothetical protein